MNIHCPSCNSVIVKGFNLEAQGDVQVKAGLQCPNCKRTYELRVESEPGVAVFIGGRRVERDDGGARARSL
jgi:phage FluMu protein Com